MAKGKAKQSRHTTIVGIGASAGGIEALQALFEELPADLGHSYVVILHLSPDHPSDLPKILSRHTAMPVTEVEGKAGLEPDHVYVISPNRRLEISDNSIASSEFDNAHKRQAAIDLFFRSLAATHGDGFALILSGGGSDGTVGAKAVKEAGGVILVQDPADAEHGSMPQAAITAGLADVIAPARELAVQLIELTRNREPLQRFLEPEDEKQPYSDTDAKCLQQILELLRTRTGHDFSRYKHTTVLRRLARRMQLNHVATFEGYLSYLRRKAQEIPALLDDLLITVTSFFRDEEAWQALQEQVIAPLVKDLPPDEPIRVWVAGCATGEEAYSMAIAFSEELERQQVSRELVIFASDIDEESLNQARAGKYPSAIEADVSERRLERYFTRRNSHYMVGDEIRSCIIFAQQSLFRDPPFSGIHLVSCRNLLIYLQQDLQEQVQRVLRYACRDGGFLFLGTAESASTELFRVVDKHNHIYRTGARPRQLQDLLATTYPLQPLAAPGQRATAAKTPYRSLSEVHLDLLEVAAPPSILVGRDFSVLHLSESAGRYMRPRGGTPGQSIEKLLRKELQDAARRTLNRAFEEASSILSDPVALRFGDATRQVWLLAQAPDRDEAAGRALLMFLEADVVPDSAGENRAGDDHVVSNLQEKLRMAESQSDAMRAEHYDTLQELRAANEELQSLNEEYRSTAEELETSKEELQSVNEELHTVNSELRKKLEEISNAHNDLENLMAATHIATLFLDRDLRIKRFTPQLTELFNVKSQDEGRPISDFSHRLEYSDRDLADEARSVLSDLTPVQHEVSTRSGETLMVRMFPYRTVDDRIEGVVLTFVDITEIKNTEALLRNKEQQLENELHVTQRLHRMSMTVATARDQQTALDEILAAAIDLLDGDFGIILIRDADEGDLRTAAHQGITAKQLPGMHRVASSEDSAATRAARKRKPVEIGDVRDDAAYAPFVEVADEVGYRAVQATPLIDQDGKIIGVLSTYYREPQEFKPRHNQISELLARQAALLIVSSQQQQRLADLYAELREHAATIEANEQKLKTQASELLEQDRAKEEFLNLLGHELRNPLAAICNSLEVAQLGMQGQLLDDGKSWERSLGIIDRQSRHMTRLVNDLLDISRINQGKLNLNREAIDLRECVNDVVSALGTEFENAELKIRLDLPKKPLFVLGDPERLMQVLDNLLRNAIQFTDPGGTVEIGAQEHKRGVRLSVRDSGIGMDPEQIESLFEPYRQASKGGRHRGLGLGLALARQLAQLHDGAIRAHSDGPGQGSEFVVELPTATTGARPLPVDRQQLPSLRVLVVDDDPDNANSLTGLLDSLGQDTATAFDGETALDVVTRFRPQVIFLDISMPGMSGEEVAQRLRDDEFDELSFTLVGLSGQADTGDRKLFDHQLLKPASLSRMKEILKSAGG